MKVTNKTGLPQALVDAIQNDPYDNDGADISVTTLLKPVQMVALSKRYPGFEEDAADSMWALMGQAIHAILERAGENESRILERRFAATVAGWKLSGQIDALEGRVLSDYKMMSVWEIIYGLKPEKVLQLNILAWLAQHHGHRVDDLQVVGILRDWSASTAARDQSYPQIQVVCVPISKLPAEHMTHKVGTLVKAHQEAESLDDVDLPPCTDEERWYSGGGVAVMKTGRKSALRVLSDLDEATKWMADNPKKGGTHTEVRKGQNKRCDSYCSVGKAGVCPQYNKIKFADEVAQKMLEGGTDETH